MHMARPLVALLLLLSAPACDDAGISDEAVTLRPGGYGCSVCGLGLGNAPTVNTSAVHEFSLDGTFNADGVRLLRGEDAQGNWLTLTVEPTHGRWIASGDADDVAPRTGAALVGTRLVWDTPHGEVRALIDAYDDLVPSWALGGAPITVYRAKYRDKTGTVVSLCPSSDIDEQWFTLIVGETYDRVTNEVIPTSPDWVTIACVTEAAAKVKRLGYHAGGVARANLAQRQATVRMITADYCGIGVGFTASGVPVGWRDAAGFVAPPYAEDALEAKWGPDGALCLDTPRFASSEQIGDGCEIPRCDGDAMFTTGVVWRTMLP